MSEQSPRTTVETVYWINTHEPMTRREKVRKKLFEIIHPNRGTYLRKERIPFTTTITRDEVSCLEDQNLVEALESQVDDVEQERPYITVPVATIKGRVHSHTWCIPVRTVLEDLPTTSDQVLEDL